MDEEVRRADLYLRGEFPHFKTRIFKLRSGWYLIFVQNFGEDFSELEERFNNEIKPITVPVHLVQEQPFEFEEEIPVILDAKIASSLAGIQFNTRDLKNILVIKFPKIEFCHVEGNSGDNKIKIYTRPIGSDADRDGMLQFLRGIDTKVPFHLIEDPSQTEAVLAYEAQRQSSLQQMRVENPNWARMDDGFNNPVLHVFPSKFNRHKVDFEQQDESFWFENVNGIFEGQIDKNSIFSLDVTDNACYLDYAGFRNVNIRNGLVLFDKVFVELPVDRGIEYFCQDQKVMRDELFQLCRDNKLVFVLTQPYFRYDFEFLNLVYKTNPRAILSRRALTSLVLCDIVAINRNYILNDIEIVDAIYELSRVFAEASKLDHRYVYDALTWPTKALRNSFECLLFGSTKRIASFGINNVFRHFTDKDNSKSLEFEFMVNSEKVHVASALDSFYFPVFNDESYSNRVFTSLMGNMLNLYKNSSKDRLSSYVNARDSQRPPFLPAIDLIEVNDFFTVSEINEFSKHLFSGSNFKSVFAYLSSLSQEERERKVLDYNKLVQAEIIRNKKSATAIDFAVSASLDTVGIVVPFLGTGLKAIDIAAKKFGLRNLKNIEKVRRVFSVIDSKKVDDKKVVSFLAKINPVARLKRDYY